jgi:uncharacterized membrane protein YhaH (DUF805 family)
VLWNVIIAAAVFVLLLAAAFNSNAGLLAGLSIGCLIFGVVNIIPNLALSIRRLHDTGKRWYWIFLPYIPMVAYVVVLIIAGGSVVSLVSGLSDFSDPGGVLDGLLGNLWSGAVALVIIQIAQIALSIWFIVLMATPTSPGAIGESTHGGDGVSDYYGQAQVYGSGAPALLGVTGMYRNADFFFEEDEELLIGRDAAEVHVVITSDSEKISRKHCSISYDPYNEEYIVIDYSSNGTYKDDGSRLVANLPVRLRRGSTIYLANRKNTFRLT